MTLDQAPTYTNWYCPHCEWAYHSPIEVIAAWHKCGKGVTAETHALEPKEPNDDE